MSVHILWGNIGFSIGHAAESSRDEREQAARRHAARWENDVYEAIANLALARKLYNDALPTRHLLGVLAETSTPEIPPLKKRNTLITLEFVVSIPRPEGGYWDLTARARYEVQELEIAPSFDEREMRSLFRRCVH